MGPRSGFQDDTLDLVFICDQASVEWKVTRRRRITFAREHSHNIRCPDIFAPMPVGEM
jgi:hypothetical protein